MDARNTFAKIAYLTVNTVDTIGPMEESTVTSHPEQFLHLKKNNKQRDDSSLTILSLRSFGLSLMYELLTWKFQGFSVLHKMSGQ